MTITIAEEAFSARIATDPARPFVTFYDDATGERAELSARSLGNWVAKTYFLITDELGLGPGHTAVLRLPVHWLLAPILFGCWFAGLDVSDSAAPPDLAAADVAFADPAEIARWIAAGEPTVVPEETFAVSLLSMARSGEPPPGMRDYAASVRPHADNWQSVRALGTAQDAALGGESRSRLFDQARQRALDIGLPGGSRLMYAAERFRASDWVTALVAPLAVAGSTVLVRHPDPEALERRRLSENVDLLITEAT